jgi:hypothetical protein
MPEPIVIILYAIGVVVLVSIIIGVVAFISAAITHRRRK